MYYSLFIAKNYIKDDLLAEDVVQDSFLDIVKNIKKYEKNNGYGWICKIVKNNALNALKKENKLLKHKNIRDRIMHYLYEESLNLQSNTIEFNSVISFSKILSIPRPTLSKELSKLKDEKLINITKRGQRCFITLLK